MTAPRARAQRAKMITAMYQLRRRKERNLVVNTGLKASELGR
jgi:hypothetical protein